MLLQEMLLELVEGILIRLVELVNNKNRKIRTWKTRRIKLSNRRSLTHKLEDKLRLRNIRWRKRLNRQELWKIERSKWRCRDNVAISYYRRRFQVKNHLKGKAPENLKRKSDLMMMTIKHWRKTPQQAKCPSVKAVTVLKKWTYQIPSKEPHLQI